jgi:hypothetical protein
MNRSLTGKPHMPSYWAGPECTTLLRSVREQRALPAAPPSIWVFFCQEVFREHPHRPLVCRHRRRSLGAVDVYSQIIGAVRDSSRLAVPVAATYLGNKTTTCGRITIPTPRYSARTPPPPIRTSGAYSTCGIPHWGSIIRRCFS